MPSAPRAGGIFLFCNGLVVSLVEEFLAMYQ